MYKLENREACKLNSKDIVCNIKIFYRQNAHI